MGGGWNYADSVTVSRTQLGKTNRVRYPSEADSMAVSADLSFVFFDPNTVDSLTLLGFGLAPHKVRTFLRYRNAGARFYKPMDLTRVYSFDDDDLDRLLPYVRIAESVKRSKYAYPSPPEYNGNKPKYDGRAAGNIRTNNYPEKFKTPTKIDINTADTTLLMRVPGIGQGIARRIVRYRSRLGGFHSVGQVMVIDFVEPEMMEWFEVQTDSIVRINLSTMTFAQLASHPYIGSEKARNILTCIRLLGPFSDVEAVRASAIFSADELERLSPYLRFD